MSDEDRTFNPTTSFDVFHWPEFIALAKRLNIDLSKGIRKCRVSLDIDDAVIINCEYVGEDVKPVSPTTGLGTFPPDPACLMGSS